MPDRLPTADWTRLKDEPDREVPLPGGLTLRFRRIPAGAGWIGSRGSESSNEEPRHRVLVPQDFYLGKFVVTQVEWRAVVEATPALAKELKAMQRDKEWNPLNPSLFKGDRLPVEQVSWDDAGAWLGAWEEWVLRERPESWLAQWLRAGWELRLPTEAEWEYACRGPEGAEAEYYNGDGEAALAEVGWYSGNADGRTHDVDEPVGAGRPETHPWGLVGMHGNVWEWCRDVYRRGSYRERLEGEDAPWADVREGEVDEEGNRRLRVVRGGSWVDSPGGCRSAYRYWGRPDGRSGILGFRVCLAPGPAEPKRETGPEKAQPGPGDGGRGTSPESDGQGGALDCGDLSPPSSAADLSAASFSPGLRDASGEAMLKKAGDESPGRKSGDQSPQSKVPNDEVARKKPRRKR